MRNGTQFLTRSALLLALASVGPLLGLPQFITGVAVTTVLYVSAAVVGPVGGIIIGCLTPWLAALRGILPPPLVVAAPFIMLGNIVLVLLFHYFRRKIFLVGIIAASLAKFAVIFLGAQVIIPFFWSLEPQVVANISKILGLPQLITALASGLLTFFILQAIPAKYFWENRIEKYKF